MAREIYQITQITPEGRLRELNRILADISNRLAFASSAIDEVTQTTSTITMNEYTIQLEDYIYGTTYQITVTSNSDGSLTLSTPQNIATSSTPTFAGLILSGISGYTLDVVGKGHFQTGGVLSTDGIIVQATPDDIPALGAPIPEIRGDVYGGLTTVFGLRGGMFLLQNSTDLLAPIPILYFTDDVGDISVAASIDYDPSARYMRFQNANIFHFIPGSSTSFSVMIGLISVATGVVHVQRDSSDDYPFVKLQNNGAGDVTQSFQASSTSFFSIGIDGSVSGKPFCMSISEKLAVANNAFTIDRAHNRTGIKTTTPNSTHDINGSKSRAITSVAADTTLGETHETLLVDASGAARIITLPARSDVEGRVYTVKKIDSSANTVTVTRAGLDTIDGATTVVLSTQYQARTVQAGPSEWNIIHGYL